MSQPNLPVRSRITPTSTARFEIRVQGEIPQGWADRFGEMAVTSYQQADDGPVSVLSGRVPDQTSLMGILQSLYGLQLPLISVELRDVE